MARGGLRCDAEEAAELSFLLVLGVGEDAPAVTRRLRLRLGDRAGAAGAPDFFRQFLARNGHEAHLVADDQGRPVRRRRDDVPLRVPRQQHAVHLEIDPETPVGLEDQGGPQLVPAAKRMMVRQDRVDPGIPDRRFAVERDDGIAVLVAVPEHFRLNGQKRRFDCDGLGEPFEDLFGEFFARLGFPSHAVADGSALHECFSLTQTAPPS